MISRNTRGNQKALCAIPAFNLLLFTFLFASTVILKMLKAGSVGLHPKNIVCLLSRTVFQRYQEQVCGFPFVINKHNKHCLMSPLVSSKVKVLSHQWAAKPQNYLRKFANVASHSSSDVDLSRKIMLTPTIQGQLELYRRTVGESINIANRVAILFNIAKIVQKAEAQRLILAQELYDDSAYVDLLKGIALAINQCKSRHLANVMWALWKLEEEGDGLQQVCLNEILQRDVNGFNLTDICQIVGGCVHQGVKVAKIFESFQNAMLAGNVKGEELEDQHISGILTSYAKANFGSEQFFQFILGEVATRNMAVNNRTLSDIVWSFAKRGVNSESMFSLVEAEIIKRGTHSFHNISLLRILWAFLKRRKNGNSYLFKLIGNELLARVTFDNTLSNGDLASALSLLARGNVTHSKFFVIGETEILKRGISHFDSVDLVIILYSFAQMRRKPTNPNFIGNLEEELCQRNFSELREIHLAQILWSLAKLSNLESKLFNSVEPEVLKRLHNECKLSPEGVFMILRGLIETQRGSRELFEHLCSNLLKTDLSYLTESQLCEAAWCLSLAKVENEEAFSLMEKEILNRDKHHFKRHNRESLLKSFQRVGRGSKILLNFLRAGKKF